MSAKKMKLLMDLAANIRAVFDCIGDKDGNQPRPGERGFYRHAYEQDSVSPSGRESAQGCLHCMAAAALDCK